MLIAKEREDCASRIASLLYYPRYPSHWSFPHVKVRLGPRVFSAQDAKARSYEALFHMAERNRRFSFFRWDFEASEAQVKDAEVWAEAAKGHFRGCASYACAILEKSGIFSSHARAFTPLVVSPTLLAAEIALRQRLGDERIVGAEFVGISPTYALLSPDIGFEMSMGLLGFQVLGHATHVLGRAIHQESIAELGQSMVAGGLPANAYIFSYTLAGLTLRAFDRVGMPPRSLGEPPSEESP